MSNQQLGWILVALALLAANLPWLSERFFFVLSPPGGTKRPWMRLAEWVCLLALVGVLARGLERLGEGRIAAQDWEFYAVGACLFAVFALPGFIVRHLWPRHRRDA